SSLACKRSRVSPLRRQRKARIQIAEAGRRSWTSLEQSGVILQTRWSAVYFVQIRLAADDRSELRGILGPGLHAIDRYPKNAQANSRLPKPAPGHSTRVLASGLPFDSQTRAVESADFDSSHPR